VVVDPAIAITCIAPMQIGELQRVAEARINSLPPPLQAEFKALNEENRALGAEMNILQTQLEQLNAQVEASEAALKRDRVRDEYAILEKRVAYLKREKASLDEEMAATRLDPAQARERLLAKVKEDNVRMQVVDKELKQLEEENAARRKTIAELKADTDERRGEAGDSAKYELLFKRDQEMTEFIDRFDEMKDKEVSESAELAQALYARHDLFVLQLSEQNRVQNTIVALLEHISEGMDREKNMPTREQAEEMKEEYSDKSRELKAAHMTQERLQEELQLRQTELEKISTLDVKIAAELKSLKEKMVTMKVCITSPSLAFGAASLSC
jgi:intraflagellar transport protein 74